MAEWYAINSGNCKENSGANNREVEVRRIDSMGLVLSRSILKEGHGASNESYSSRAYKKKRYCLVVNMSRKANDQGRFDKVKTRLTTEEERGV